MVALLTIANLSAQEFGIPVFDIAVMDLDAAPIKLVNEKLIRQHRALPLFKRGNRLFVAVSDPTNLAALDEIKFHTGVTTEPILVEEDKLSKIIDQALDKADTSMSDASLLDEDLENLDIVAGGEDDDRGADTSEIDETPVVRFVNKILLDAINRGASDIHVEPYEKTYRVRYRQDGVLYEVASPPLALAPRISARLKVMSRMDIAERRLPQDGRIKMHLSKSRAIDFRVNSCPTLVRRKNRAAYSGPEQRQAGYRCARLRRRTETDLSRQPEQALWHDSGDGTDRFRQDRVAVYRAEHSQHAGSQYLHLRRPGGNQPRRHQPVQYEPQGRVQFRRRATRLPAPGPDIIMVREIRDLETAEIAIKAAQTGHMVMSTLHTNDAPQTLARLANMGVPAYNIASAVNLIIAQRLARRLCSNCKRLATIPAHTLLEEGSPRQTLTAV